MVKIIFRLDTFSWRRLPTKIESKSIRQKKCIWVEGKNTIGITFCQVRRISSLNHLIELAILIAHQWNGAIPNFIIKDAVIIRTKNELLASLIRLFLVWLYKKQKIMTHAVIDWTM